MAQQFYGLLDIENANRTVLIGLICEVLQNATSIYPWLCPLV